MKYAYRCPVCGDFDSSKMETKTKCPACNRAAKRVFSFNIGTSSPNKGQNPDTPPAFSMINCGAENCDVGIDAEGVQLNIEGGDFSKTKTALRNKDSDVRVRDTKL